VGVDGALRPPRGAARVEDHGRVVLRDRILGQVRVRGEAQQLLEARFDLEHRDADVRARHPCEPLAVADQEPRIAVLDPVEDLVGGPPAVQRRDGGAEARAGPERHDPLGAVRGEDRDPVSGSHPVELPQRPRRGGHEALVFGVGDPALPMDHVLAVAERRGGGQDLAQRAAPVAEDGHPLAEDLLFDDLEGGAGSGEPGEHLVVPHRAAIVSEA